MMSKEFYNIIEGLDKIVSDLGVWKGGHFGVIKDRITRYLSSLWLGEDPNLELTFKGLPRTMQDLADEISKGSMEVFFTFYPKEWNNPNLGMKWINNSPKNWEIMDILVDIYSYTVIAIGLLWNPRFNKDVIKSILNIFYRLTNYNDGAIVSLRDLIDFPSAKYLTEKMVFSGFTREKVSITPKDEYTITETWSLAVQGLLFTLEFIGVKLPAPFNFELSILERKDTLQQTIKELESAFRKTSDKKTDIS